jgi:hypothetical protein
MDINVSNVITQVQQLQLLINHFTLRLELFTSPFQCAARCEPPYNFGTTRGGSQSATMWLRLISFSERQPFKAIVSSNSSRSIWSTFLTPASPSAANEKTTGLPIWSWTKKTWDCFQCSTTCIQTYYKARRIMVGLNIKFSAWIWYLLQYLSLCIID